MAEPFEAKIRVVRSNNTGQISDVKPEQFQQPDMNKIANITNQVVVNLQNNLLVNPAEKAANSLSLSEVELTFGIDFEVEAGGEVKVPLIGPTVHGGVRGGATFEVHIKLSRGNS
jgi:hypothetical protein